MNAYYDKASVAQKFSQAAEHYDDYTSLQYQMGRQLLTHIHKPHTPHSHVLDIGCATGKLSVDLQHITQATSLSLLDISADMLTKAQVLIPNAHTIHADIEAFQLPCKYQLIFSHFCLQWANDLGNTLRTLQQSLTPNGQLLIALPVQPSLHALTQQADELGIDGIFFNPLPSQEQLTSLAKSLQLTLHFYSEEKIFNNLFAALKHLKKSGASSQAVTAQQRPNLSTADIRKAQNSPPVSVKWVSAILNNKPYAQ